MMNKQARIESLFNEYLQKVAEGNASYNPNPLDIRTSWPKPDGDIVEMAKTDPVKAEEMHKQRVRELRPIPGVRERPELLHQLDPLRALTDPEGLARSRAVYAGVYRSPNARSSPLALLTPAREEANNYGQARLLRPRPSVGPTGMNRMMDSDIYFDDRAGVAGKLHTLESLSKIVAERKARQEGEQKAQRVAESRQRLKNKGY